MSLLQKMRRLNKIQQRTGYEQNKFDEICQILAEELDCNVYVISRKGKILGYEQSLAFTPIDAYKNFLQDLRVPEEYNDRLLSTIEPMMNLDSTDERVLNVEKGLDLKKVYGGPGEESHRPENACRRQQNTGRTLFSRLAQRQQPVSPVPAHLLSQSEGFKVRHGSWRFSGRKCDDSRVSKEFQ